MALSRGAAGIRMRCVDHDALALWTCAGQSGNNPVEHAALVAVMPCDAEEIAKVFAVFREK